MGTTLSAQAFEKGADFVSSRDIPGDFPVLDLRNVTAEQEMPLMQPPLCIRVDDSLTALNGSLLAQTFEVACDWHYRQCWQIDNQGIGCKRPVHALPDAEKRG